MVSDKTVYKAFRIHQLCKQNQLETFFIFTIYPNYALPLIYLNISVNYLL